MPVPADDLKNLRDEFRDAPVAGRRLGLLLRVTSNLPPTPATPLDRAVSKVEEALSGSMTSLDASSEEYLALLLEALSNFQGLERGPASPERGRALSRITRLCVEWVARIAYADSPCEGQGESGILAEVRARVESDPAVGGFLTMTALAGEAAARIDEARESEEGRRRLAEGLAGPDGPEPEGRKTMSNSHRIAAKLEDYLKSGYFSGAIMDVYMLINHIHFLEQQVAGLKATIARIQSDTGEE